MRQRARKLVGTLATILILAAYSLAAMVIGGQFVVGRGMVGELIYFVLAGIAWLPAVMALVRWMAKPDLDS